ncbi:unnamed protein product [Psylliodes chrysocephalus]|uniref:Peptidase S1 domain-containing protein n=1 Tax=Psylliodes chrysocephalus TaxID=3402493 RepID=A0A9P0DA63_9CUCU|nr:unnamed protein product [Psylliodes chrysocephala]
MILIRYKIWTLCIIFTVCINISYSKVSRAAVEPRIVGGYQCSQKPNVNIKFMVALTSYRGELFAINAVKRDKCVMKNGFLSSSCPVHYIRQRGIYSHPRYTRRPVNNDISLLRLETPMYANKNIQYVKLPSTSIDGDVSNVCDDSTILGWGWTKRRGSKIPIRLMCVDKRIMSTADCIKDFPKTINTFICTEPSFKKDACHGDSGGPLVCGDIQYGITSFVPGRAKNRAVFFTRVDKFLDFIHYTMKNNGLHAFRLNFVIYVISLLLLYYNLPY